MKMNEVIENCIKECNNECVYFEMCYYMFNFINKGDAARECIDNTDSINNIPDDMVDN